MLVLLAVATILAGVAVGGVLAKLSDMREAKKQAKWMVKIQKDFEVYDFSFHSPYYSNLYKVIGHRADCSCRKVFWTWLPETGQVGNIGSDKVRFK